MNSVGKKLPIFHLILFLTFREGKRKRLETVTQSSLPIKVFQGAPVACNCFVWLWLVKKSLLPMEKTHHGNNSVRTAGRKLLGIDNLEETAWGRLFGFSLNSKYTFSYPINQCAILMMVYACLNQSRYICLTVTTTRAGCHQVSQYGAYFFHVNQTRILNR